MYTKGFRHQSFSYLWWDSFKILCLLPVQIRFYFLNIAMCPLLILKTTTLNASTRGQNLLLPEQEIPTVHPKRT